MNYPYAVLEIWTDALGQTTSVRIIDGFMQDSSMYSVWDGKLPGPFSDHEYHLAKYDTYSDRYMSLTNNNEYKLTKEN